MNEGEVDVRQELAELRDRLTDALEVVERLIENEG